MFSLKFSKSYQENFSAYIKMTLDEDFPREFSFENLLKEFAGAPPDWLVSNYDEILLNMCQSIKRNKEALEKYKETIQLNQDVIDAVLKAKYEDRRKKEEAKEGKNE